MRYVLLALERLSPPGYGIIDTEASLFAHNRYFKFGEDHSRHYGARDVFLIQDKASVMKKLDQLNAEEETK